MQLLKPHALIMCKKSIGMIEYMLITGFKKSLFR